MNKSELVAVVSEQAGLTKVETERVIDAVFDTIIETMRNGDEVRLMGFGTFVSAFKPASEGRNPRTGEKIHVEAHYSPKFKPGKLLKETLQNVAVKE